MPSRYLASASIPLSHHCCEKIGIWVFTLKEQIRSQHRFQVFCYLLFSDRLVILKGEGGGVVAEGGGVGGKEGGCSRGPV